MLIPYSSIYHFPESYQDNSFRGVWNGVNVRCYEVTLENESPTTVATLTKIKHSNIALFFGISSGEKSFSVFEDLSKDLFSILLASIPLPWQMTRINILVDVAKGLNFLHNCNITHGNVKSANIFILSEGRAKLTNINVGSQRSPFLGKWNPPELQHKSSIERNKSADVYCLGMVIWEVSERKISLGEETQGTQNQYPPEISEIIHNCWKARLDSSQILDRLVKLQCSLLVQSSFPYIAKDEEEEPMPGVSEYQRGRELWELGKTEAISYFVEAAEKGNKTAFIRLDHISIETTFRERYVEKIRENRRFYEKEARSGDPHALYNLGICYEYGYGGEENADKALSLYLKCASMGYIRGYFAAGNVYLDKKEYVEAINCFKYAEDHGLLLASTALGDCYRLGSGVPPDEAKAAEYYEKAAKGGEFLAQQKLAGYYERTNGSGAIYWLEKAASFLHPDACYSLGRLYTFAIGVPEDKEKALDLVMKAVARGRKAEALLKRLAKG